MQVAEAESLLDSEMATLIKMKIRAAYKPNKSKQRV